MEITEAQYERIAPYLPVQRGNVSLSNLQVLNAILYVAEHGCKWRGLPTRFGNWHTIYTRMNLWSKNRALERVFDQLQRERIVRIQLKVVSLDSTLVKVHPDGRARYKKRPPVHRPVPGRLDHQDSSGCRGCSNGLDLRAVARTGPDAPEGRKLLNRLGHQRHGNPSLVMDRAYEGNETQRLALALGFTPVVPPLRTRVAPWAYDRETYKRRNEIERLFRRLKGFRRIFSRFEKLDALYLGFILFALIVDALR